ncbi:hypothetical protein ABI59_15730 [Acidobacteria bacterium Mor1]|nr:hypothetical protein ABI59_15730 [Acidobacteria bacterium Mor1]
MQDIRSIEGICDVEWYGPEQGPVDLLIEVPHGATRATDYTTLEAQLHSALPEDLQAFFFVNTDIGTPECARAVGRQLAGDFENPPALSEANGETHALLDQVQRAATDRPRRTLVLLGRVPRTFVDLNRVLEGGDDDGVKLTPPFPGYIEDPRDRDLLTRLHAGYQEVADRAYAAVCDPGGKALCLHSYAPRSVNITDVDAGIVKALRKAYEPETYAGWPVRPEVDLITEDPDGNLLAPADWADAVVESYRRIGVAAGQNGTYRLSPRSAGYRHAAARPDQVLCAELRRDLLAEPFDPFVEMTIGEGKAWRMALPLSGSLSE